MKKLMTAFATIGRTGAGKTTIASFIAEHFPAMHINQAGIKEAIKPGFSNTDCLNEEFRDLGYFKAIFICRTYLESGYNAIIDASFHRQKRREWFLQAVADCTSSLIFMYLRCDEIIETERRIRRRIGRQDVDSHASDMKVYEHIDSQFEEPTDSELKHNYPITQICVDTWNNSIITIKESSIVTEQSKAVKEQVLTLITTWLDRFNDKEKTIHSSEVETKAAQHIFQGRILSLNK